MCSFRRSAFIWAVLECTARPSRTRTYMTFWRSARVIDMPAASTHDVTAARSRAHLGSCAQGTRRLANWWTAVDRFTGENSSPRVAKSWRTLVFGSSSSLFRSRSSAVTVRGDDADVDEDVSEASDDARDREDVGVARASEATPAGDASHAFHRRRFFFFFLGGVGSGFRSSVGSRISSVGGGLVPPQCPEAFGAGSCFEPVPVACKEAS